MFCLLIWRCLQVKSSISRADGQKKVTVAIYLAVHKKKSTIITGTWVRHLNTILAGVGGGGGKKAFQKFERTNLQKFKL